MQTRLNPYIGFKGNAREALEFYQTVFGGKLDLNTFGENGVPAEAGDPNKIMHGMLEADNGITFMASDAPNNLEVSEGSNISMSLSGDNEAELRGYWDKLSDGASITEPLVQAPWGDTFGMLTDKFGTDWMVNIAAVKTNE
jgi:PhnB protein